MIPYSMAFFAMYLLEERWRGTGKFFALTLRLCLSFGVNTLFLMRSSSEKFRLTHCRDDN